MFKQRARGKSGRELGALEPESSQCGSESEQVSGTGDTGETERTRSLRAPGRIRVYPEGNGEPSAVFSQGCNLIRLAGLKDYSFGKSVDCGVGDSTVIQKSNASAWNRMTVETGGVHWSDTVTYWL